MPSRTPVRRRKSQSGRALAFLIHRLACRTAARRLVWSPTRKDHSGADGMGRPAIGIQARKNGQFMREMGCPLHAHFTLSRPHARRDEDHPKTTIARRPSPGSLKTSNKYHADRCACCKGGVDRRGRPAFGLHGPLCPKTGNQYEIGPTATRRQACRRRDQRS